MEINIGQQRTRDASLRGTLGGIPEQLLFHHAGTEEFPDQIEESTILDTPSQYFEEHAVVDRVEVGGEISLNDPEELHALIGVMPDGLDRIHRAAIRSEPKGVLAKFRLVDGFQDHAERFLDNPIADRRDA